MYQGHLMGPPTDPGPSDSARVSKWSVRPCSCPFCIDLYCNCNVSLYILALYKSHNIIIPLG
ncbi:unnamed protein product [Staurois parvus]|uniref:Uncharacterized protein n=1 Tax=Staurois parvus TaxID=386267 RepID=A0ABN9HNQ0_9NEOB|nr:unnamed protein product [Staurois parvus]